MLPKYQEALDKLVNESYELAHCAKEAFEIVVEVLESKDLERLKEAKALVKGSTKREAKIDMRAIETLALYSPEASDLRKVATIIKMSGEFSRICDYVKAQANTLMQEIINEDLVDNDGTRLAFYKSTLTALSLSVDLIRGISIEESKCDDFVSILEKSIISTLCDNKEDVDYVAKRLNSVRKLERISDRCVNIAKLKKFAIEGGKLKL